MVAHDFLVEAFKKRTKIGAGCYQFSYGRLGWVTLFRKFSGEHEGKWEFHVCRHNEFETLPTGESKTVTFGVGPVETVEREGFFKTMKEALDSAEYHLLTREQRDELRAFDLAESDRIVAAFEAQQAANKPIWDDLRARGLVK